MNLPNLFRDPSDAMLLAGVGLMTFVLLRVWFRKRRRARKRQQVTTFGNAGSGKSLSQPLLDAPPQVARWQVEMHELARELKAELDSKMSGLQALILEAERKSQQLEAQLQALREDAGDTTAQSRPVSNPPQLGFDPSGTPNDELCAKVFALYDQGQNAATIAEQLGLSFGDIEMLLSLRVDL